MRLSTPLSSRARLLLPAALGASLATHRVVAQTPEAATPAASPVAGSDWLGIATTMWETIQEHLYIPEEALYLERTPKGEDDRNFSYLWPYASLLSGITNLASISPEHEAAREQAFESLQRYYDDSVEPVGYDSYVVDDGGGDKFYDDNEWLGIDFVHAYRATGNATYLDRAVITWNFAISGWTDALGGGIHWKQYDMSTKNTCSNGPAAVLALLLHAETQEQQYLDWAVRIMEWVVQLKDPATGVYRDNIHVEGRIEPMTWTYNTGTPMHANALLYEATGDEAWLQEARALAEASLAHFAPLETIEGQEVHVFPDTPWFNSILFRGYEALYQVDPEPDRTFLDAALGFTRFGWEHARDENGLMQSDWSGRDNTDEPRPLIDQAPILEIAAIGHRLQQSG